MKVRYLAAFDGGGTGTRVRLCDLDGKELGTGQAGPSGLGQGVDKAWVSIICALKEAFGDAKIEVVPVEEIAIGLGLAGTEVPEWAEEFHRADPGFAHCALASDAMTFLLGAHGGRSGIVVIGGTGSVAMARHFDETITVGGWGFGLGDEGSGAWIGEMAVQNLTHVVDGRATPGLMSRSIQSVVGPSQADIIRWRGTAGQKEHGDLSPLVFDAAACGDATAQQLLQCASEELEDHVRALDRRLGTEVLPVAVGGSVAQLLCGRWPKDLHNRVIRDHGNALDGALVLLREHMGERANA